MNRRGFLGFLAAIPAALGLSKINVEAPEPPPTDSGILGNVEVLKGRRPEPRCGMCKDRGLIAVVAYPRLYAGRCHEPGELISFGPSEMVCSLNCPDCHTVEHYRELEQLNKDGYTIWVLGRPRM